VPELKAVFRIFDILVRIRIRILGSVPLTNPYPDPALFISDLQDANNKIMLILFEGTFTSFFKDKKP
jgi:hypothetical protein